ncbi:MAG: Asp-tRNA(Asn)/Glu-tRNA(Gln) amidotransferase subunit GatC [Deferribacterota bacterium]|nr:Asp-tRNA(Asn)/Glu-tRNA(Gln) amidotransferase subunit GatC [Deferribacterota bacterium]
MAELTKESVLHVARLAYLSIDDEKLDRFTEEFNDIVNYVEKLSEINTDNIEPTSHVLEIKNVFREDFAQPSLDKEEVFKNAPQYEKDHFKVPRIIEG